LNDQASLASVLAAKDSIPCDQADQVTLEGFLEMGQGVQFALERCFIFSVLCLNTAWDVDLLDGGLIADCFVGLPNCSVSPAVMARTAFRIAPALTFRCKPLPLWIAQKNGGLAQ
jgi:hypothetical protein